MLNKSKNLEAMVIDTLIDICEVQKNSGIRIGCTTNDIAEHLSIQRTYASRLLNKLHQAGEIIKLEGRPVLYVVDADSSIKTVKVNTTSFETLIGADQSLKYCIQQAKAAILYPSNGLNSLLLGPTGVGKTMFAELMYRYAIEKGVFDYNAPFVSFNCADYANNPQLLLSHLFGSKKGAFTGADKDRVGIVEKANGGILFLDEIHRLPAEGQELLFYLIDKGEYTPLGDVDNRKQARILLIGATTEDRNTVLLSTFTRRIPMMISLPTLKERSAEERLQLITEFFKVESRRIERTITVTSDVLRNLLLYECENNLGQLKSDVQLGCANGFLRMVTGGSKKVEVHSTDFPKIVRAGMLLHSRKIPEINNLVKDNSVVTFSAQESQILLDESQDNLPIDFYDNIEERIKALQSRDISEEDIRLMMTYDVEQYFRKYIYKFEDLALKKEEISKIVDKRLIAVVEHQLISAGTQLKCLFSNNIFLGLCLHLSSVIQRLREGKSITNPNLEKIQLEFPKAYEEAKKMAETIDREMDVSLPNDELGYITMFLIEDASESNTDIARPIVVIAMHGKATATSMAEVVNTLTGTMNTYGYNVLLNKPSKMVYEELRDLVSANDRGAGAVLLTDLGSLWMYGAYILEETGIDVKSKEGVTTAMALNYARKCQIESDVNHILSIAEEENVSWMFSDYRSKGNDVIITLCSTGEGSAVKLKEMIESGIDLTGKNVQVMPMAVSQRETLSREINLLMKDRHVLAVVGTFNPNIYGVPFLSVSDFLGNQGYQRLTDIIERSATKIESGMVAELVSEDEHYKMVFEALSEEISHYDVNQLRPELIEFLDHLRNYKYSVVDKDRLTGIIMHLTCTIEKMFSQEPMTEYPDKSRFMIENDKMFRYLKEHLRGIESMMKIDFSDDEVCYLMKYIIEEPLEIK